MQVKLVTTNDELEEVFKVRTEVFVKEQSILAENEFDQYESVAEHVLVYLANSPVGTGRVRVIDAEGKKIAKVERICVQAAYRKRGIGEMIVAALEKIAKEKGLTQVKLHGQAYAEKFYVKLGYKKLSDDIFIEENIPHIAMIKKL